MPQLTRLLGDNRFSYAVFEQLNELFGWQWAAEMIALRFFTMLALKKSQLFLGFYAFGDHAQPKTPGHTDYCSDD